MVKDIPLGKRAKISQAQQYMILAVFGAALFLGAAIAVIINSINKISFHASVIVAQDQSIVSFSDTVKNIGICPKPSGKVYSDDELKKCNPNSVNLSSVSGSLRSNIVESMASNAALASVPNKSNDSCINPDTEKNYTYKELEEQYSAAESDEDVKKAVDRIMACSALRVIPDALPAYKNEEALLASIDKIFRDSGTEPEALSPTGEIGWASFGSGLHTMSVRLSIKNSTETVNKLLDNVQRSIRNLNIDRATIGWSSNNTIEFNASATAYYMEPSVITTIDKSIRPGGKK